MKMSQKFCPKCCEEQGTCICRILNLATTLSFNLGLIIGGTDMNIRVNDNDIALAKRLCCEEIDENGCSVSDDNSIFTDGSIYIEFSKNLFSGG